MRKNLNIFYMLSQFFFYGSGGSLFAYTAVFLFARGFSNSHVGFVLAVYNIVSLLIQFILSQKTTSFTIKDLNRTMREIIILILVFSFILYISKNNVIVIISCILAMGFSACLTPFINSLAFVYEKYGIKINFGAARGMGSFAYAIASLIMGKIISITSSELIPIYYLIFNVFLFISIYFYRLKEADDDKGNISNIANQKTNFSYFFNKYKFYYISLIGFIGVYIGHIFVNNFLNSIVIGVNGSYDQMGLAIFIATSLELPVMAMFERINKKVRIENIILFSLTFFVLKHLLTYFATSMYIIYVAQILQIFAFALFLPASVYLVNNIMEEKDRLKGQTISNIFLTSAGIISSIVGGILIDKLGISTTLLIICILSILGACISFYGLNKLKSINYTN